MNESPTPTPPRTVFRITSITVTTRPSMNAAANLRQNPAASPVIRAYGVVNVGRHGTDRATGRPGGRARDAHDPESGGRRDAHPRAGPREQDAPHRDRARKPRRPA